MATLAYPGGWDAKGRMRDYRDYASLLSALAQMGWAGHRFDHYIAVWRAAIRCDNELVTLIG